jgi:hypothetical protein
MSLSSVGNIRFARAAVGICLLGSLIVIAGAVWGRTGLAPSKGAHSRPRVASGGVPLVDTLTRWDGQWYLEIAAAGYNYRPGHQSSVAFFPAYPLLAEAVSACTLLPPAWAALAVSHGFLLATCLLLHAYVRRRFPADWPQGNGTAPVPRSATLADYTVLALALFPPTFFMRMAYSESMFLFLTVLAMYGMLRRWLLWLLAAVAGLATATRFAGIALLPPLAIHICGTSASLKRAAARFAAAIPLALSGLAGFMLYQWRAFNDPLAFIKTQDFWRIHAPEDFFDKLLGLGSWEPVWSAYLRSWPGYAGRMPDAAPALVSLQFANPVFFVAAVGLVTAGAWKRWLSPAEVALAAGVIFVGYAAKGFELCMASQGRFVAAAFPIYLVLGQLFVRLPRPCTVAIYLLFGAYLAIYSALLAAGYVLI